MTFYREWATHKARTLHEIWSHRSLLPLCLPAFACCRRGANLNIHPSVVFFSYSRYDLQWFPSFLSSAYTVLRRDGSCRRTYFEPASRIRNAYWSGDSDEHGGTPCETGLVASERGCAQERVCGSGSLR